MEIREADEVIKFYQISAYRKRKPAGQKPLSLFVVLDGHTQNAMKNNLIEPTIERDGALLSPWQTGNIELPLVKTMTGEQNRYDVLITGGGITGLTTALLLQGSGKKCILAEAHSLGFGTTSGTSAHLNTFFDATYPEIEQDFGAEAAKLVADSGKAAFDQIREFVRKYQIDCDLEPKDAYLYAETEKETKELKEILEASRAAGLDVEEADTNEVGIPFRLSLCFKDQGQFHPTKYILALASAFIAAGGIILENTFIKNIESGEEYFTAHAENLKISAKQVIYATHIPPGINVLDFRCAPYRSYVMGVRLLNDTYPSHLIYDMQEPYHYIRTHVIDGQSYLIVGGEDHKTGHEDPEAAFKNLEAYTRQYFQVEEITFKWSSQYYVPADGLPYIGKLPGGEDGTFVATGFNGNGMILGTLSGMIIRDLIEGRENPCATLFDPSRIKPVAGFLDFVRENADVAYHFVADRFGTAELHSLNELEPDTGKVLEFEGEKLAVYKEKGGKIHALSSRCTHAGCIVNFNAEEKSWDCPCHGGRYDLQGKVLTGPPRENLKTVQLGDAAPVNPN